MALPHRAIQTWQKSRNSSSLIQSTGHKPNSKTSNSSLEQSYLVVFGKFTPDTISLEFS